MKATPHALCAFGLMILCATSCLSLERDAPSTQRYVLELDAPAVTASAETRRDFALGVRPLHVAAAYAGRKFVYRRSGGRVESDYYSEFQSSPGQALAEATIQWLDQHGSFAMVHADGATAVPRWLLEGDVSLLCCDLTTDKPTAVLAVRLSLHDADGGGLLLNRRYESRQPIASESADDLVEGWRQALGDVLAKFAADLP